MDRIYHIRMRLVIGITWRGPMPSPCDGAATAMIAARRLNEAGVLVAAIGNADGVHYLDLEVGAGADVDRELLLGVVESIAYGMPIGPEARYRMGAHSAITLDRAADRPDRQILAHLAKASAQRA
jgi:hypothetical protein